jgi:hypothetical protein
MPCSSKDSLIFGGSEEYTVVGKGNYVQISFGAKMPIFLNVYYVHVWSLICFYLVILCGTNPN